MPSNFEKSSLTHLRFQRLCFCWVVRSISLLGLAASSVVSSRGPTSATKEHEKRILESILPPDLRHLVRGGSPGTIQARTDNIF